MFKNKIFYESNKFDLELIKNKRVVFTNGCFDIIHPGHLSYLYRSSNEGDVLIVGVNSDSSVKINKGDSRPINGVFQRAEVLSYFSFIDYVIVFNEETPIDLIKFLNPNVLVKGSDYSVNQIIGADHVMKIGGYVKTLDFIDGYSSSNIIKKINK